MPYDPALPADGSPLVSAEMRAQFFSLKALIDALPGVTSAEVDSVNTLPAGSPAGVSLSLAGGVLHFSFSIPQGTDGAAGAPGTSVTGAQVDSVATLNPGDAATAGASFDGALVHFSFGIPRGADGEPAPPPEVTLATLDAAIAGTSSNSNAVGTLDTPFADPDAEALRGKVNELLAALRRV